MLKNLFIAVLLVTVSGALVVGILDAQSGPDVSETVLVQAQAPVPTATATVSAPLAAGSGPVLAQQSVDQVGTAWIGSGNIVALTDFGLTLGLADGTQVYIELGPPTFWQAQGVALGVGDVISVQGFFNGEQYHAQIVTNASGAQMALRNATGQPLWSGGAAQSGATGAAGASAGAQANAQTGAQAGAGGVGQVQVAAEDWVSLDGTVTAVNQNGLTIQTATGEALTLQFGRADFWQSQAVTFAAGDAVQVRGFWQADQFQTGQVTKLATGERLLLRDPNGRPLWGGPGRTGAAGTGTQTGTQGAGQGGNGAGGSTNGNGNGNGRRGNRNG